MEKLKSIKECLVAQVQNQLGNLANVDAKELGEVVDMVKDMEEAIYYATITKAMGEKDKEKEHYKERYYTTPTMYYRDIDRYDNGRMYYDNGLHRTTHMERDYPVGLRDMREGRSPITRKMYMESKEMHHDKSKKMKELEQYMRELSDDIVEMIEDASPEEKQILHQKLNALVSMIN